MSRVAHEVSRRLTPEYAKERARDMARRKAMRMRESAVESSWLGPLLGAGVGALVARAIQSRAQERRDEGYLRWEAEAYEHQLAGYPHEDIVGYGRYPYPRARYAEEGEPSGGGVAGKAAEMKERASEVTGEVKERVGAGVEEAKGRIQGGMSALRERIPGRETVRASAREDTAAWALGAMALGALFGFALPVSRREQEMLEPARRKARELAGQAKELAAEKGAAVMEQATARVEGRPGQQPNVDAPSSDSAPPLH
jgi:hypothetical protein